MLSFSITLGIDVANATNWQSVIAFMSNVARRKRPALAGTYITYLKAVGKWKEFQERRSGRGT